MKYLLFILLFIPFLVFSQTDSISHGELGSSVRTKLNATIVKGNQFIDTTVVFRTALDNATDTLTVHDTKINQNIQSASDNSDSVAIHLGRLDDGVDTMAIHLGRLDDGVDSTAIHLGRLDDGVDTLAVHDTKINANIDDIENIQDSLSNVWDLASTITYDAYWVNDVSSAGITGDASALTTVGDDDTLQIEEGAGGTSFDTRVSFKTVTEFNNVQTLLKYKGGAGHEVHLELYNPNTTAWVVISMFSDQDVETFFNIPIINGADYIDGDSVIVRFEHPANGNASHYLWVDYLVLKKTPELGGGGVSSHYALSNIGTITHDDIEDTITIHDGKINVNIDSITIHREELDSLLSKSNADDLRISILEGADVTAPAVDSAFIRADNDSIIWVLFDELLGVAGNDSLTTSFSATYGTETFIVDSAIVAGLYVLMYGTNIPSDSVVYVSYSRPVSGGLHDPDYNYTASFTNKLAFNGTVATYKESFAFWRFNGNLNDNYGNYNASAVNTIAYTGDTALIFSESDGDDAANIGDIITGDFSMSFWLKATEDLNENYYLMGNGKSGDTDVWYTYLDGSGSATFDVTTQTIDGGGTSTFSKSAEDVVLNAWTHLAIVVDIDQGSGDASIKYYIDGSFSYDDTTHTEPFNGPIGVSGTTYIGNSEGSSLGFREGMIIGEAVLFDEFLTTENIDSLYAIGSIGGDRLWQTSSTPTPPSYDTSYVIYEYIDFASWIPQSNPPEDTIADFFTGALREYGGQSRCNLVVFEGDTVLSGLLPALTGDQGVQIRANFPADYDSVWHGYDFHVPADWSWPNKSGKIWGIMAYPASGSFIPGGGLYPPGCDTWGQDYEWDGGATLRGLIPGGWLTGVDYSTSSAVGAYVYHHGMWWSSSGACVEGKRSYGENLYYNTMTPGQWNRMDYRYVMNTVTIEGTGDANGIIEVWLNGVCVAVRNDYIFRNYSNIHFDAYMWTLLNGSDPERTQAYTVYFQNATLWNFADGHPYAVGHGTNAIGTVMVPPYSK